MTEYFADKKAQLDDVAPTLAALTTQYKGDVWGLPYYTYTAGYIYRQHLFDPDREGSLQGPLQLRPRGA